MMMMTMTTLVNLCILLGLLACHSSAFSPSSNGLSPLALSKKTNFQKQLTASTIVLSVAAKSKEEDLELTRQVIAQYVGMMDSSDGEEEDDDACELIEDNVFLLDRIGGEPALTAAVDEFYNRVIADPKLAPYFEGVTMLNLKEHQLNFLRMAFTEIPGDCDIVDYISSSHDRLWSMGLDETDFDAVAGHLVGAMQALGVEQDLIDEAVGIVGPLRVIFEGHQVSK